MIPASSQIARVWQTLGIVFLLSCALSAAQPEHPTAIAAADPLAWPSVTQTARPWTRWWWLGSAVDDVNITRQLEEYQKVGLGGVEITCIYGARGSEDRYLPYLSEKWRDAVRHTIREAKRLDMGVDLPTGSGWRTGGPSVIDADANMNVVIEQETVDGGREFTKSWGDQRPQAIVAYGDQERIVDLAEKIANNGQLAWRVPEGKWKLYTVTTRWSRDNVKRPAPGGEGKNINPLSRHALANYLNYFGKGIGDLPAAGIRAQFHDSYEYDGNWCDDYFDQFERRRGYRLQDHLPELAGEGSGDDVARIKHDYRETVSDLIIDELIQPWTAWSHERGMSARNQGHGSPGNWLDIYAACDIPETESFGRLVGGDGHPLVFKFASSAAHVAGRPLVSAETATWIDEHFNESLGQVKEMVDRLFLAGVNHVIYHGTAYSPQDAAWPGWLFYASTQLNPQNPLWRDFPALNQYVARCQSVLQSTKPDNNILLYWPIHDYWTDYKGLRKDLRVHNAKQWLFDTPFGRTAQWLEDHGHTFDYVSDRQLANVKFTDGRIEAPGGSYASMTIPGAKYLPLATLRKLVELADAGATITFIGELPIGPPGLQSDGTRKEWSELFARLRLQGIDGEQSADSGHDAHIRSTRPAALNDPSSGPRLEHWAKPGRLNFIRRTWNGGHVYFIKNRSDEPIDEWIVPAVGFESAAIFDPLDGRVGLAEIRDAGKDHHEVRIQLAPGQSMFLKTAHSALHGPRWIYDEVEGEAVPLAGRWSVEFLTGGPELPSAAAIDELKSWTKFAAPEGERFAGTARYTIKFDSPAGPGRYRLHLGTVADSAAVELNGKPVATLIASPFQVDVDLLEENELTIDVTNVAANRIRDLDRRKIEWRIFHDINLVSINYRRFDASDWPLRDAGLIGPVTLQKIVRPVESK